MEAMHTCRPNDDESRNLQTTKNSGIVVEETVREINERKNRENNFLTFNAPEPKNKPKGIEGEDRYGVCWRVV